MAELKLEMSGDMALVECEGEITSQDTPRLKSLVLDAMEQHSLRAVVLDLSRVSFLDSSGIGTLVTLNARTRNKGTALHLLKPDKRILKTLELVQLLFYFSIIENVQQAER